MGRNLRDREKGPKKKKGEATYFPKGEEMGGKRKKGEGKREKKREKRKREHKREGRGGGKILKQREKGRGKQGIFQLGRRRSPQNDEENKRRGAAIHVCKGEKKESKS